MACARFVSSATPILKVVRNNVRDGISRHGLPNRRDGIAGLGDEFHEKTPQTGDFRDISWEKSSWTSVESPLIGVGRRESPHNRANPRNSKGLLCSEALFANRFPGGPW
jgi:hypothetical protein